MTSNGIYVIESLCGLYFNGIWTHVSIDRAKRYKSMWDAIPDMDWLNSKPGSGIRWTVRVTNK